MSDDTKAPELLPCPFCGKCDLTYRAAQIGDSYYCNNCGAYGPLANPETIKDKWNTRHDLHLADEGIRIGLIKEYEELKGQEPEEPMSNPGDKDYEI